MRRNLSSFRLALFVGGALCASSCSRRMPRAYLPPPLPPVSAAPVVPPLSPPWLDPVGTEELARVILPQVPIEVPDFPEAPKAPPRPKGNPPPPPPKPLAATVPTPVEPLPRITQMFTTEQYRAYTKELDDTLLRVGRVLEALSKKNLTAEERDKEEQIITFQKQAVQAREQDLVNAVNLARRADLLAKDLLERLP